MTKINRASSEAAGERDDMAARSMSHPAGGGREAEQPAVVSGEAEQPADVSPDRIRPTDLMSAQQRRELIDSMKPEDAEGVPELHDVDIPASLKKEIEAAMGRYPETHSALIPALWAVQRHYGWCSPEGLRQAAAVLRLTPGEMQSVASFYDLFHLEPTGKHDVLVCHNISCWMRGADDVLKAFKDAVGDDPDFHVTGFECLGACDIAPMASVNETYYGPLEPGDAATIVDQLRAGTDVMPDRDIKKRPAAGGSEGGNSNG